MNRLGFALVTIGVLGMTGIAFAALGGTTYLSGLIVVEDKPASHPTCATATVAGELCVEGDIESNGALDVLGVVSLGNGIVLSDGAVIDQSANNKVEITENAEDLQLTFASNLVTLGTSTGASFAVSTASTFHILNAGITAGWTAPAAANTACATTCAGTGACLFGLDVATTTLVDCASALADTCICAGPSS
jgi:hypothetical protein